jgi:DNA-binding PucR family transcriptional regulator
MRAEVPELASDQALLELMEDGAGDNVRTALQMMRSGADRGHVLPPPVALDTARRLAQRGIPVSALLRAYRIGQAMFQQAVLARLAAAEPDTDLLAAAAIEVTTFAFDYIDRVSEEVVETYQRERDHWLRGRVAARIARVTDILAGRPVDVPDSERMLAYRFQQTHVGVVVWDRDAQPGVDRLLLLEQTAHRLAERVGARRPPLLVAVDGAMVWAWLPSPQVALDGVVTTFAAELDPAVAMAAGEPAQGLAGFRLTHRQARQAQVVAAAAQRRDGAQIMLSAEIGPVALMCSDLDAAAAWVRATLGGLAFDDEAHARLRETLWAFLSTGGSFTAAAQQLILHKNTVQYRVRKAEEARGRPVQERRLDLELALLISRLLGASVLVPPAAD